MVFSVCQTAFTGGNTTVQKCLLRHKMLFAPLLYSSRGQYLNGKMSTLVQLPSLQVSRVLLSCRTPRGL